MPSKSVAAVIEDKTMKRLTATTLGFLVAPLAPVIVGFVITPPRGIKDLGLFLGLGAVVYIYAGCFIALFGVPAYLLCNRWHLVRWWSAMLAGLLVGSLSGAIFRLPNSPQISDLLRMASSGMFAGLLFWLVWRRGKEATA